MATSQVKRLHEATGRQVFVVGVGGQPQWSPVFDNNPRISRTPGHKINTLLNGPGARPYIAGKTGTNWQWRKWDIAPGEVWLTDDEREFAEPYRGAVLIEPHTKVPDGNKSWCWERWHQVVEAFPARYVQVGKAGTRPVDGAEFVATTFRQGMAVLSACRAYVGPEGALHHAAAAFGIPAIVLWSHFVAPEFTGYETQTNIRHADGWCGARFPCAKCRESMDAITVQEVTENMRRILC